MRYGSLFSGIGGLDLAVEMVFPGAGAEFMCEENPYCREILKRHWPGVVIHEDVRSVSGLPGSYGPPRGVDARRRRERIRVLGNAVVPQQAAVALVALLHRIRPPVENGVNGGTQVPTL